MANHRTPLTRILPAAAALLALLAGTPASAQWTGRGEAGLVIASGNSESKTGNARLQVRREADPFTQEASLAAVYSSDDEGSTAQRWEAAVQASYNFSPRNYSFASLRYEDDNFSGFEHQGTASGGVGHKFRDDDTTRFTAQLGVGYKFSRSRDTVSGEGVLLARGESASALATIGTVDYRHSFNAATSLLDKFTVEHTSEDTFVQNEISLQVKMLERLALAVGYAVRYHTDPPPGFGNTDTLTTMNIVYEVQ